MLYYGQLVVGPAGSGKVPLFLIQSTYCHTMQEMAQTLKRNILIVNLDPAAENNKYRCDVGNLCHLLRHPGLGDAG